MRPMSLLFCGLLISLTSTISQAQTPAWPQHTVRMITPLGPGSGMDVVARTFAERLSAKWGQPVVVENRQGADGILAVQSFLSDRDNHSLMFAFAGLLSINPLIHGDKLPYDVRDVVPVASAIDSTLALTVSETAKINTLAEFVKAAKERPGQLNWAATTGLPLYVVAVLQKSAGIDITQIAYRDFSPAFQDFATGRVQLLATGINLLLPGVAELVEVSVRVVLLHLDPEGFEGACVLGCTGGKVELPVELVDAEPVLAVTVESVIERRDLEPRSREITQQVRGSGERYVEFPVCINPDAALSGTDRLGHLACAHCPLDDRLRQRADDLALHVLKKIVAHKLRQFGILDAAGVVEALRCAPRQRGERIGAASVVAQAREVELDIAQGSGRV